MEQEVTIKKRIQNLLTNDPLFIVLQDTPLEEILYTESYLTDIIDKKFYSTPEVAGWFEITDAQLRYYIKPFENYIFDNMTDNPTTSTVIRLNLPSILRLRMILLLKDEYRVKGLKRLLAINENGYVVKQQSASTTTAVAAPDELANKVEMLSNVLQQIMQTGLFNMQQDDENGDIKIAINQEYLSQSVQLLSSESTKQISEVQDRTEKLAEENESLQKQITELKDSKVKDVVVKMRERQIENEVTAALRTEALQQFATQKKSGMFAKLFRSSQIELEKERFINQYLTEHLSKRLEKALTLYHNQSTT